MAVPTPPPKPSPSDESNADAILADTITLDGRSTNRKIFSALVTVGSWTILVKLLALFKEALIAHRFGVGDQLDAFYTANILPQFAASLVGGAVYATFVPVLVREWQTGGRQRTQHLLKIAISVSLILLVLTALIISQFGPWFIAKSSSYTDAKLSLSISLFFILLPTVVTIGVGTLWAGVLNTTGKFAAAAATPTITTTLVIIILVAQGQRPTVETLAWGTVLGSLLEMCFLGFLLFRQGWKLTPGAITNDPATMELFRKFLPMAIGNFVMTTNPVIDQTFAASLGPGAITTLNYANKLVMVVVGVASTAISKSVLPHLSVDLAKKDYEGVVHTMKFYTKAILAISIPLTLTLIALSGPVIKLFFERGAFKHADTLRVAQIQSCYLIQIPFYLMAILLLQGILAEGKTKAILKIAAVLCIVNFVLDFVLMRYMGLMGIALSTTGVYLMSSLLIGFTFRAGLIKLMHQGAGGDGA